MQITDFCLTMGFLNIKTVKQLHLYAGCAHLLSALVLLFAGSSAAPLNKYAQPVSNSFWEPSTWRFVCYNGTGYVNGTSECPDKNRTFRVQMPPGSTPIYTVNTLLMAVAFAAVSGGTHIFAWWSASEPVWLRWQKESKLRFGIDYAISAPIMLALFSVMWGANNILSAIVAPVVLSAMLRIALRIIVTDRTLRKTVLFAVLVLGYTALLWLGIGRALLENSRKVDTNNSEDADRGVMPRGVVYASIFVLLTFSSFIVPYGLELKLKHPINNEDNARKFSLWYAALSLVAKVTLHAMFGITAINQATVLTQPDKELPAKPPDMAAESQKVIGAGTSIIGAGIVLYICASRSMQKSPEVPELEMKLMTKVQSKTMSVF